MAKYTIEDIEILRQKSGISYEEAVNLLEYHNGSLARALVDLEKNGRLKNDSTSSKPKGSKSVLEYLYHLRIVVKKEQTIIINLSSLFILASLLMAAHICVIGLIAALMLGYHISIVNDREENIHKSNNAANGTDMEKEHAYRRSEKAASGKRPVNVQFPKDGQVDVRDDGDGYHEADIQ